MRAVDIKALRFALFIARVWMLPFALGSLFTLFLMLHQIKQTEVVITDAVMAAAIKQFEGKQ